MVTAILVAAAAIGAALLAILRELQAARRASTVRLMLAMFGRAAADVDRDPRELVAWHRLASGARQLFPEEFGTLDKAVGGSFPFTADQIQTAHARWTTDWLSWERSHDFEYKLKAAAAEEAMAREGHSEAARGRLQAVEREKLERYQQRYEEYVRVSKALAALAERGGQTPPASR